MLPPTLKSKRLFDLCIKSEMYLALINGTDQAKTRPITLQTRPPENRKTIPPLKHAVACVL